MSHYSHRVQIFAIDLHTLAYHQGRSNSDFIIRCILCGGQLKINGHRQCNLQYTHEKCHYRKKNIEEIIIVIYFIVWMNISRIISHFIYKNFISRTFMNSQNWISNNNICLFLIMLSLWNTSSVSLNWISKEVIIICDAKDVNFFLFNRHIFRNFFLTFVILIYYLRVSEMGWKNMKWNGIKKKLVQSPLKSLNM